MIPAFGKLRTRKASVGLEGLCSLATAGPLRLGRVNQTSMDLIAKLRNLCFVLKETRSRSMHLSDSQAVLTGTRQLEVLLT